MRREAINLGERIIEREAALEELFASGRIHPHISAVHPLADTAVALRSMLERTATGKVLIDARA